MIDYRNRIPKPMKPLFDTTKPIFELVAQARHREPSNITRARRFCLRAEQHGVSLTDPLQFRAAYVIVKIAGRVIRIDDDGAIIHTSADPQGASNNDRAHAQYLALAGRFRRRGQRLIALAALDNCARYRGESPFAARLRAWNRG